MVRRCPTPCYGGVAGGALSCKVILWLIVQMTGYAIGISWMVKINRIPSWCEMTGRALTGIMVCRGIIWMAGKTINSLCCSMIKRNKVPGLSLMARGALSRKMLPGCITFMARKAIFHSHTFMIKTGILPRYRGMAGNTIAIVMRRWDIHDMTQCARIGSIQVFPVFMAIATC